ncbi:MAG: tRNA dihydrouridine(20/20a) synthase DusA [Methyloligellaceae bacterium]
MTERHSHTFSVAPMMDWTDRHCRAFHRQISHRSVLYTEMVTADAVWFGERERLIGFDDCEHPVALQLGGSNPEMLGKASAIGEDFGYDEINLNVGCPSDRVQSGKFGACLMAEPELVADCVSEMRKSTRIPVTVKCRIGIDDQDEEEDLARFIEIVKTAGCELFIVHARKAWLQGLSPKENRDIPPLDYNRVYRLKAAHPDLTIIINGGIETLEASEDHLQHVDGVMIGREAYKHPYMMAEVDNRLYGDDREIIQRKEAVEAYFPYIERQLSKGTRLHSMTRHILGLFQGQPGAKHWRRHLSENAHHPDAGLDILQQALDYVK